MTAHRPAPETIPQLLATAAASRPDQPALGRIDGGALAWATWKEVLGLVAAYQRALSERGVGQGVRVAQVGPNSVPWVLTDLALMGLGAVHVPLHATLAPAQAAGLIAHREASLAVLPDPAAADRLRAELPSGLPILLHRDLPQNPIDEPPAALPEPDDLATILYTSGTTGPPLGVILTHRNLAANAIATTAAAAPSGDELRLCLLPLSHIYARTCDLYCWLVHGGRLVLAESRETVFRDCAIAAPTAINAVPYFYQKVVDRLRAVGTDDAADLRAALGGSVRRLFCGGAALAPEVDRFFAQRGLPILCGYGLTESSPVITATPAGQYRSGTVGPPLAGVEVQLADDGEVLTRGPHVMRGYWRNEEATARVLRDGWLATGDLGEWDAAGHLRIVGRKKEIIVLATGKKVAPTVVEQRLSGSPWIEQACVVGDGRKCLAALVVPNGDALRAEVKRRRLWVWSRRRALNHPQVLALYRSEIDRCLRDLAEFEQIGAFTLIGRMFSLDQDEVTPKLSLRRGTIQRRFAREIESMYRSIERR